jgi:hypothetical protein
MSTGQAELAKRAALLSALPEHCEVLWLRGQPIVISDYTAVCNTLRRVLTALSPTLERQPREIDHRALGVWPEYAQEADRARGRDLRSIEDMINALPDDSEPPKPDSEPPAQEDSK